MSATASLLLPLLIQIGADASVAQAFDNDPEAVMNKYQLTEQEKAVMRTGDVREFEKLLSDSIKGDGGRIIKAYADPKIIKSYAGPKIIKAYS